MKYIIRDREAGNIISKHNTFDTLADKTTFLLFYRGIAESGKKLLFVDFLTVHNTNNLLGFFDDFKNIQVPDRYAFAPDALATLELYAVQACRSKKAAADIKKRINNDYKSQGLL
ncbi:MAG: hypothetical protein IJK60_05625 [Clostridia bacterium]|nr:hypothetical protein [Clostridia bacterium]